MLRGRSDLLYGLGVERGDGGVGVGLGARRVPPGDRHPGVGGGRTRAPDLDLGRLGPPRARVPAARASQVRGRAGLGLVAVSPAARAPRERVAAQQQDAALPLPDPRGPLSPPPSPHGPPPTTGAALTTGPPRPRRSP